MIAIRLLLLTALLAPAALAQTWSPQTSGTANDFNDVYARSTTEVYAAGDNGTLLRTTDGGQTWTQLPVGGFDFEGVAFSPDGAVGIVATDDGPVLRSTDGLTWTLIQTGSGDNLRDVSWASNTAVWSLGREGDGLRSTDAGLTWSLSSIPNTERLRAIAGISATAAIAVGEIGQIFSTTNGTTWTAVASPTGADLHDIQMVTATTGYIVGSNNVVLKTTNGGSTWTSVSTGGAGGDGVFFLDVNTGWVVDNAGQIWFTDNGGTTWVQQASGVAANLEGVHFASASRGWAVGDAGTITAFTGPGGGGGITATLQATLPITIPAGGGSFQFRVLLANTGTQPVTFQAWTAVTGPVNQEPVAGPQTLTVPAGVTVSRIFTQQVPGIAPAGTYTFSLKAGTFPAPVTASDDITFTKSAALALAPAPAGDVAWTMTESTDGALAASVETAPSGFTLSEAAPNPFTTQARLTLAVAEAQRVRVEAFDALGRRVAVLLDGEVAAGTHTLVLDAAALPAGVYVVRATGETVTATRRAFLAR